MIVALQVAILALARCSYRTQRYVAGVLGAELEMHEADRKVARQRVARVHNLQGPYPSSEGRWAGNCSCSWEVVRDTGEEVMDDMEEHRRETSRRRSA